MTFKRTQGYIVATMGNKLNTELLRDNGINYYEDVLTAEKLVRNGFWQAANVAEGLLDFSEIV